jgi:Fe-S oxidoreductase
VGAEVILTDCNSCVHNFRNAKLGRQAFRIYHTAQFIEELLERKA